MPFLFAYRLNSNIRPISLLTKPVREWALLNFIGAIKQIFFFWCKTSSCENFRFFFVSIEIYVGNRETRLFGHSKIICPHDSKLCGNAANTHKGPGKRVKTSLRILSWQDGAGLFHTHNTVLFSRATIEALTKV